MSKPFLCIHGHFYQPPRENPWLERVERQPSASPAHDWNERVYQECYRPNTMARVYGAGNQVVEAVNSFEWMSFNIGPTLFSWLQATHPHTARRIVAADRRSAARNHGHGNAMAQVYNHQIMPLASARDQLTQVRWGAGDFVHRFGRQPEAMWLPETACNSATLKLLAAEGLRFALLAPSQAARCRPLKGGAWQDVSNGSIDPTRPYLCRFAGGLSLAVFFYDGPISAAVGFEDLLSGAGPFLKRLLGAKKETREPQLIHVATDGETYGHHKPYGDRVLAYLLAHEAPRHGLRVTNYGAYLAAHPPEWEVEVKEGNDGLGTAWSCSHGTGRWRADCGCRGGGPPHWKQAWRAPLRQTFDWLRSQIDPLFEQQAGQLLADPWAARDDYIQLILSPTPAAKDQFFTRHGKPGLTPQQQPVALRWLEQQRNAMLMYTSCAWFFTDIGGIETAQVMKYGARAMELTRQLSGHDLEEGFLRRLSRAKGNDPLWPDGKAVFHKQVAVVRAGPEAAAARWLMDPDPPNAIHRWQVAGRHKEQTHRDGARLIAGRLELTHAQTDEQKRLDYAFLAGGRLSLAAWFKPASGQPSNQAVQALFAQLAQAENPVALLNGHFEKRIILEALPPDDLAEVISRRLKPVRRGLERAAGRYLADLRRAEPWLPEEHLGYGPAAHMVETRLLLLEALRPEFGTPHAAAVEAQRLLATESKGESGGLTSMAKAQLDRLLLHSVNIMLTGDWDRAPHALWALETARQLKIELDLMGPSERLLGLLVAMREGMTQLEPPGEEQSQTLKKLGNALSIKVARWLNDMEKKEG